MKRILTAVVLISVVVGLTLFASDWLFITILGLVAVVSTREFLGLAERLSTPPKTLATAIVVAVFSAILAASTGPLKPNDLPRGIAAFVAFGLAFVSVFLFLGWCLAAREPRSSFPGACLSFAGVMYICLPLACLYDIRTTNFVGNYFLILLFILVWCGDIAAFYAGKVFGKHKLAPLISPGKTWEGALASLLCSALVCVIITVVVVPKHSDSIIGFFDRGHSWLSLRLPPPPIWWAIVIGIAVNVTAQLGDLVESMMKRAAGVKDSGTLLPGHGGMLDRIDALLFAAPAGWLLLSATTEYFQRVNPVWPK